MDGVAGLEPAMTGSKPVALPLGYTPVKLLNYYTCAWNCLCKGDVLTPFATKLILSFGNKA
jgi:hypothetical protein